MPHSKYILCIDDDDDDCLLLKEALSKFDPSVDTKFIHSGILGVEFLKEAKEKNELPELIILDINMPAMDGKETLMKIHNDLKLEDIPAVFISTSPREVDVTGIEHKRVAIFRKPSSVNAYEELAQTILQSYLR